MKGLISAHSSTDPSPEEKEFHSTFMWFGITAALVFILGSKIMFQADTICMSAFALLWIGAGLWIEYIIRRISYMNGTSCGLQLGLFIVGFGSPIFGLGFFLTRSWKRSL